MTIKCQSQTNQWHTDTHMRARTQLKQSHQLSPPQHDDCRAGKDAKNYISKQGLNAKTTTQQTMTTESPPLNGQQQRPPGVLNMISNNVAF